MYWCATKGLLAHNSTLYATNERRIGKDFKILVPKWVTMDSVLSFSPDMKYFGIKISMFENNHVQWGRFATKHFILTIHLESSVGWWKWDGKSTLSQLIPGTQLYRQFSEHSSNKKLSSEIQLSAFQCTMNFSEHWSDVQRISKGGGRDSLEPTKGDRPQYSFTRIFFVFLLLLFFPEKGVILYILRLGSGEETDGRTTWRVALLHISFRSGCEVRGWE